jgi:hypothetical protein
MIYNHLFLHGTILALKSKANRDMPFFPPFMFVSFCSVLHVGTILMIISILRGKNVNLNTEYKFLWAILFMSIIASYYLFTGTYKRILCKAHLLLKTPTWISILIVTLYYIVSLGLMFFAALYKNKDWIFAS